MGKHIFAYTIVCMQLHGLTNVATVVDVSCVFPWPSYLYNNHSPPG